MLTVDNINVEPNEQWFVKLSVDASKINVGLYLSRDNAVAGSNLIASGSTSGFGNQMPVNLTQVAGSPVISKFQTSVGWHLEVSGQSGETMEIYSVGPFTDLDDVSHAVYRNGDIIPYRAAALIDESTNLDNQATVLTTKIDPSLNANEVLRIQSTEMNLDRYYTIGGIDFEFDLDQMLMTVKASNYTRMVR